MLLVALFLSPSLLFSMDIKFLDPDEELAQAMAFEQGEDYIADLVKTTTQIEQVNQGQQLLAQMREDVIPQEIKQKQDAFIAEQKAIEVFQSTRQSHTVRGKANALHLMLQKLEKFSEEVDLFGIDDSSLGKSLANTSPNKALIKISSSGFSINQDMQLQIQQFLQNITNPENVSNFFLALMGEISSQLSKNEPLDMQVAVALTDFIQDLNCYFVRFMECESDSELKLLLVEIENRKTDIIENFNQCSLIVYKLVEIVAKLGYNYCLKQVPEKFQRYLPAVKQTALVGLSLVKEAIAVKFESVNISSLVQNLGKGYLSGIINLLVDSGYVEVAPSIKRSVYFAERLAKIFFIDTDHVRALPLTYNPNALVAFPLKDSYFKGKTFEQLTKDAFAGNLGEIKNFAEAYPQLLFHEVEVGINIEVGVSSKKANLLSYAISGYCDGNDYVWPVVYYLVDQEMGLTNETRDMLSRPSTDKDSSKKADRDKRKQRVLACITAKEEFFMNLDNATAIYGGFSQTAPQDLVVRKQDDEKCIIS